MKHVRNGALLIAVRRHNPAMESHEIDHGLRRKHLAQFTTLASVCITRLAQSGQSNSWSYRPVQVSGNEPLPIRIPAEGQNEHPAVWY